MRRKKIDSKKPSYSGPFQRVGLVIKLRQPDAAALASKIIQYLVTLGVTVYLPTESPKIARSLRNAVRAVPKSRLPDVSDLIIVVGGDGTYIGIARLMQRRSVPIVGINMGQLGFLTEIRREETFDALDSIFRDRGEDGRPSDAKDGGITVSERDLLEVSLKRGKKVIHSGVVVNDVVISKGAIARIINLELSMNGRAMYGMRADGVIISSPTGSTAYSLAAGGPILEPSLDALVITAICPHSLTQRPLVVSNDMAIRIRLVDQPTHVLLTLDGQDAIAMKENDIVTVRRFRKHKLKLVRAPQRDYFGLLREKFNFGTR